MQTLLKAKGAEVFAWLENGAAIYVCGDASRMASDVDQSLSDFVMTHGARDAADLYFDALVSTHRYQRDVY